MDLLYDLWYRFCQWCEWLFGEPPEMPEAIPLNGVGGGRSPLPLDPREKIHELDCPLALDIAELSKVIYYYRPKAKLP